MALIPCNYTLISCICLHLRRCLAYKMYVYPRHQFVVTNLLWYPKHYLSDSIDTIMRPHKCIHACYHIEHRNIWCSIWKFNKLWNNYIFRVNLVHDACAYLIIIASFSISSILQMSLIVINVERRSQSIEQIFGWKWMKWPWSAFLRHNWEQYASHSIYIQRTELKTN